MSLLHASRRARSFVDPEVQGGLLKKIAVHWTLLFAVNALALVIWVRLFEQPEASWATTFGDCVRRFLPFFVITILLIPAFIWDTLKITSRFAGPVLRLRAALANAAQGREVTPLKFRNNDFWQEIADDFNTLVERHRPAEQPIDTRSV
ncbi:MAG: hypothetical protein ACO1RT_09110 [Planctomycetaceae bacterium]